MNIGDLKMYIINLGTLAISMSAIDTILKITLLVVSIGYTVHRWYHEIRAKRNNKKK
jgi:hypothetical protein